MADLLPANSSPLERAAARALADIQAHPSMLRRLWNPDTCPATLLPYLAWSLSIDRWDTDWSEEVKRNVVRSAFYVHQRKGTIAALRRVVEPLGYLLRVKEWWQHTPPKAPGTFALRIGVLETGITDEMYHELTRLVDDARPVSRHIDGLDLLGETRGQSHIAVSVQDGEETTVYPYIPKETRNDGRLYMAAFCDGEEVTTVYPEMSSTQPLHTL